MWFSAGCVCDSHLGFILQALLQNCIHVDVNMAACGVFKDQHQAASEQLEPTGARWESARHMFVWSLHVTYM